MMQEEVKKEQTIEDFKDALQLLRDSMPGLPNGGWKTGISHLIQSIAYKLNKIEVDEAIKAKQGKEYFEAKDGVKPTTEVVVEKVVEKPKTNRRK